MHSLLVMFFLLLFAVPARAGDDIEAVSALWSDFVSALRRGDYPRAYGLFSPESRESMPYDHFVGDYGPLTTALEMVLAKPESRFTRLEGEWAELTYDGFRPGSGHPFRVAVAAVRNQGSWALVAGRNEVRERTEAAVRTLLLALTGLRHLPNAMELTANMVQEAMANQPALRQYSFDAPAGNIRALPQNKGLRAFHVDAWGQVRPGQQSSSATPPSANVPVSTAPSQGMGIMVLGPIPELAEAVSARPPVLVNGLPELSEPPLAGTGETNAIPGSIPELLAPPPLFHAPGLPSPSLPSLILEPERFELPEVIG